MNRTHSLPCPQTGPYLLRTHPNVRPKTMITHDHEPSHNSLDTPPQGLKTSTVKHQAKNIYMCAIMGEECRYMLLKKGKHFRNFAELKYTLHSTLRVLLFHLMLSSEWIFREDALRHLCALQCSRCGRKFGKTYSLKRHKARGKCKKPGRISADPTELEQINPELAKAIMELLKAKKEEIYPAINLCMMYYSKY